MGFNKYAGATYLAENACNMCGFQSTWVEDAAVQDSRLAGHPALPRAMWTASLVLRQTQSRTVKSVVHKSQLHWRLTSVMHIAGLVFLDDLQHRQGRRRLKKAVPTHILCFFLPSPQTPNWTLFTDWAGRGGAAMKIVSTSNSFLKGCQCRTCCPGAQQATPPDPHPWARSR